MYPGGKTDTQLQRPAFASDGTVLLAAASTPGNSSIIALAPTSGTLLWRVDLPQAPAMDPVTDANDVVYVGFGPSVWALDVNSHGSSLWQFTYPDPSASVVFATIDTLGRLAVLVNSRQQLWCPVVFLS